jgi:hypothetical protein
VGYHRDVEGKPLGVLFSTWRAEFAQCFPEVLQPKWWGGKEYGQAKLLLDRYPTDQVQDLFIFTLRNWKIICDKFFKGQRSAAPTVGFVLRFHDALLPDLLMWNKFRAVLEEYEAFDPKDRFSERPGNLRRKYIEACKELKALGLR